jgi:hypothetical protein
MRIYKTLNLPVVPYGCETNVSDIKGGIQTEGVRAQGVEENMLIKER